MARRDIHVFKLTVAKDTQKHSSRHILPYPTQVICLGDHAVGESPLRLVGSVLEYRFGNVYEGDASPIFGRHVSGGKVAAGKT